jgi:hypothetical protein
VRACVCLRACACVHSDSGMCVIATVRLVVLTGADTDATESSAEKAAATRLREWLLSCAQRAAQG